MCLTAEIFRNATQLGKVICRPSILGTHIHPKHSLFWQRNLSTSQECEYLDCRQRERSAVTTTQGFLGLEFVLVDKRDPLFLSLVLAVYCPKELKQNEGIPFLPPPADQRRWSPSRTYWEPPTRAIPLALPKKGSSTPWLIASPAKQAEAKRAPAKWALLHRQEQRCHCQYWDFSTACIMSVLLLPLQVYSPNNCRTSCPKQHFSVKIIAAQIWSLERQIL